MAFRVEINFTITQDGEPFHKTSLEYDNMSYEQVVVMERFGTDTIERLTQYGESMAKGGPGKKR